MFLANCCKRYCGGKTGDTVLPDLKDLILKPEAINSNLDEKINNWQSALNELKDVEYDLLDKYPDLLPVLNEIKSSPWTYQQNVNETYSFFSSLVIRVIECERLLPQQSDEETVRSARSQSTTSSVMDWSGENPLLESKTVGIVGKLSSIWSKRLNGMNQTQGALVISTDPDVQNLRLKPKWPDFLIDVTFDVIKVNKYGHKMRRTLKLTQHHVISIKAGAAVTKFYTFHSVSQVWLQNETTMCVKLRNEKRNMYISPIAPHILQQVTTRVQVRKALDEKFIDQKHSQLYGYTSQATAEIIKSITEENKFATEDMIVSFANELKQRTLQITSMTPNPTPVVSTKFLEGGDSNSNSNSHPEKTEEPVVGEDTDNVDSPMHVSSSPREEMKENSIEGPDTSSPIEENEKNELAAFNDNINNPSNNNEEVNNNESNDSNDNNSNGVTSPHTSTGLLRPGSAKFSNFDENSPEYSVQDTVRRLIFDPTSAEGNTRRVFLQNFQIEEDVSAEETLVKIRHFIDGMHEYILHQRAFSLANIYQQQKQRYLALQALKEQVLSTGESPQITARKGSTNTSIMTNNTIVTTGSNGEVLNPMIQKPKLTRKAGGEEILSAEEIDESLLILISYIIFIVVEESIFTSSIQGKIIELLKLKNDFVEEEKQLVERMKYFQHRHQEQWGIPHEFVSPLGWQTAIFILSNLEISNTPSMQLQVLTRAVKAIYSEFKYAVIPKLRNEGKNTEVFIAADDLVPIFIYVFCQTNLQHPLQNRDLMWSLCHPDSLHGEGGYYLTVYESAMEFISNEPMEREAYIGEMDRENPEEMNGGRNRPSSSRRQVKSVSVVNALLNIPGILAFHDRTSEATMRMSFK